jgi:hypothetical protein
MSAEQEQLQGREIVGTVFAVLAVVGVLTGFAACAYDELKYGDDMEWGRGAPIEATAYTCVRPSFFGLIESSVDTCFKKTMKACLEYSSDSPAECSLRAMEVVRQEYADLKREKQRAEAIESVE